MARAGRSVPGEGKNKCRGSEMEWAHGILEHEERTRDIHM